MTSGVNAPFLWGENGEKLTPEQIERRRKLADAMIAKGTDFSPVQHPLQGVARVANALAGAIKNGQLDKAERENTDYERSINEQMLRKAFGGGSSDTAASSGSAPSFAGGGSSRAMTLPDEAKDGGATFAQIGPRLHADLVKDFSLPPETAAGVVGSLAHESGGFGSLQEINPVVPGSRGGFGYAQWTGPRREQFEQWASANKLDPTSYEANYGFLKHELQNTPEGNVLASLHGLKDPNAAAQVFTQKFLRPGIPAMDSRLKWTQRALSFGNPADMPAPGASPAALQGQGQGFVIPGQPAVAETEEDAQRLEQNMQPAQAAATMGDVFSPVPMAQPQGFSATPREAVERAAQAAGLTEEANLPATAPLPPVRPTDVPMLDAQPAMGQMPAPQGGPSQEAVTRALSDPNLSPSQVMALNGPNREATIAQILQSNPETAQAKPENAKALVARALLGMPANDNQADLPAQSARAASYQGTPKEGLSVATGGAFPQKALDDAAQEPRAAAAAGGSSGVSRVAQAVAARGIDPAIIVGMTDPRLSENTRRIATILYQQQMANQKTSHVDLGDTVGIIDARGNVIGRIAKSKAADFGPIGNDQYGNQAYGFRNYEERKVEPVNPQGGNGQVLPGQPGSVIPAPPPGVDPKIWREEQSKNVTANALPGDPKNAAELRKEIQGLPSYKNYAQASPIYRSMVDTAGRNSKASDLNLVYGLGKIMDPGSVVREGEMVMVKNTGSLPDWLVGAINSLNGGAALTPETRKAVMAEAYSRMKAYEDQYSFDTNHYRGIVKRGRFNEDDIIPGFDAAKPWEPPALDTGASDPLAAAREAIAKGADRSKVIERLKANGINLEGL